MNTVLGLIILYTYQDLSKDINYTISKYIIDNLTQFLDMSMTDLSKNCFVSTTSIKKYYQSLGFNSYSTFKKYLKTSLNTRILQIHSRYKTMNQEEWYKQLLFFYTEEELHTLDNNINDLITKIQNHKSLSIIGSISSNMIIQSFVEDMIIMGKPVHIHNINYNYTTDELDNLTLFITLSGRLITTYPQKYQEVTSNIKDLVLITTDTHYPSLLPPKTLKGESSDLILLCLFMIIKIKYAKVSPLNI